MSRQCKQNEISVNLCTGIEDNWHFAKDVRLCIKQTQFHEDQ